MPSFQADPTVPSNCNCCLPPLPAVPWDYAMTLTLLSLVSLGQPRFLCAGWESCAGTTCVTDCVSWGPELLPAVTAVVASQVSWHPPVFNNVRHLNTITALLLPPHRHHSDSPEEERMNVEAAAPEWPRHAPCSSLSSSSFSYTPPPLLPPVLQCTNSGSTAPALTLLPCYLFYFIFFM